ncbi:GntR family transcriptional regulator [Leifsonia shinshuensis]|uniref:DNA-binding GntR family transcriptional regulator n=1 Tax=Leifsonia shinshuensis TaxID=150026 RepID=A0A853CVN0_9MICO|nr:GntR family transcriptional regulator [Leifsonia shinshuensis]NYJ24349.1 DNA-binding GntR family transcriptional regulator [Leifsonia shinshuensis]
MPEQPHVYERLRSAILDLERVPGSRITERGLEAEFGASRTPLRAALMRLETEGLVRRDGRAWEVSPIDLGEIARLSELRDAVESAAVRLSAARASDDALRALRDDLGAYDPDRRNEDAVGAGADFHVRLAALSGNHFFADTVSSAMTRLARTRWLEVRTADARRTAREEHRTIVDQLAARDADAAADSIHRHIVGTHERLLAALDADARLLRARGLAIVGPRAE